MNNPRWLSMAFQMLITFPELSSILVGVLQIVAIALGICLLRWCHKRDASWVYVMCIAGVFAAMMLLPLHLARLGWAYSVPMMKYEPSAVATQPSDVLDRIANTQLNLNPNPWGHEPLPASDQTFSFDEAFVVSNEANRSQISSPTKSWSLVRILMSIYVIIALSQMIRTARGWNRLRKAAQRGQPLGDQTARLVDECRHRLRISTRVLVLRSTEVSMPLTFGVLRPVVLLPIDFEEWTSLEQQAVALHEFSHIARRDVLGELLVRSMQALYWLHPASHWIAKQVRSAREGATDQRVIATGFSPKAYANCLVQILERERMLGSKRRDNIPLIAMSAFGDMEVRINSILQGEVKMNFARKSIWITCLVLFMSFSMVRLQAVPAQIPVPASEDSSGTTSEPTQTKASPSQVPTSSAGVANESNPLLKNDLLDLIQNAPITNNESTTEGFELNLSGRVLSPSGDPARGCTVVLSRFDVRQAQKTPGLEKPVYGDTPTQNVFARTTTDEDGRYSFSNIVVPASSPLYGEVNQWQGQLIAGDSKLGIGWEDIVSLQEQRIKRELTIRLNEIEAMEGQCINSDGTPATQTVVSVYGLGGNGRDNSGLFLCGALKINTLTDSNGRFQFLHFPRNTIAHISASGESGNDYTLIRIGTNQDWNVSDLERISIPPGMRFQVQPGPAMLKLRKPIQVPVYVFNTNREPVPGAIISLDGSKFKTDDQGLLLWNADAKMKDLLSNREVRMIASFESYSPYLNTETSVRWDSITETKPIEIIVEKGTRVRGKVTTKEGYGAHGVLLFDSASKGQSASVDEQGNLEITLPKKKCRLVICGLPKRYRIPSYEQARLMSSSTFQPPQDWKCINVDATSGADIELPTIVIEKTEPINIVAQLPDGSPATNATAILTDINISKEEHDTRFSKCFLSTSTLLDNDGLASILPDGIPSKLASVEVRLLHKDIPYLGIVSLDQLSAGKLLVRLKPEWVIRGRVTLDGQPVSGAWVHAIRHISSNGETLRPESVLHVRMSTNQMGQYEFIVPRDRDYEIQVGSLPQDRSCYGSTHKLTRRSSHELEVPEFRFEQGTESIAGTVLNLKGEPIAGADVSILNSGERLWIGQSKSSYVKSDKSGRFVMPNLPHGPFRLSATWSEVPSRTASSSEVKTSSGDTNVRLIIPTNQRGSMAE